MASIPPEQAEICAKRKTFMHDFISHYVKTKRKLSTRQEQKCIEHPEIKFDGTDCSIQQQP